MPLPLQRCKGKLHEPISNQKRGLFVKPYFRMRVFNIEINLYSHFTQQRANRSVLYRVPVVLNILYYLSCTFLAGVGKLIFMHNVQGLKLDEGRGGIRNLPLPSGWSDGDRWGANKGPSLICTQRDADLNNVRVRSISGPSDGTLTAASERGVSGQHYRATNRECCISNVRTDSRGPIPTVGGRWWFVVSFRFYGKNYLQFFLRFLQCFGVSIARRTMLICTSMIFSHIIEDIG